MTGLVFDRNGLLYGAASGADALGSLFALKPPATPGGTWSETLPHRFTGVGGDGWGRFDGLLVGKNGEIYGVADEGGTHGMGTVFSLKPPEISGGAWTETVLYSFTGEKGDGAFPRSTPHLIFGRDGALYGTTRAGGAMNAGAVFRLMP
jgi:uncharacterized repeat protein (TIGR03803 family)